MILQYTSYQCHQRGCEEGHEVALPATTKGILDSITASDHHLVAASASAESGVVCSCQLEENDCSARGIKHVGNRGILKLQYRKLSIILIRFHHWQCYSLSKVVLVELSAEIE